MSSYGPAIKKTSVFLCRRSGRDRKDVPRKYHANIGVWWKENHTRSRILRYRSIAIKQGSYGALEVLDFHQLEAKHGLKQSDQARMICRTALILWDEAPMMSKFAFEAVNRTLCDINDQPEDGSLLWCTATSVRPCPSSLRACVWTSLRHQSRNVAYGHMCMSGVYNKICAPPTPNQLQTTETGHLQISYLLLVRTSCRKWWRSYTMPRRNGYSYPNSRRINKCHL